MIGIPIEILKDREITHEEIIQIKHRLQIYRRLREYHVPRSVAVALMTHGVCILQKIMPYKEVSKRGAKWIR